MAAETRGGASASAFPPSALALSLIAASLATAASAVGLAVAGFYHRDPAVLQPQLLGQDLVTLVVAAPLLAASAWFASRGSARAHVAAAGALLYMAYTYATYAFGARFNALFLVYVALLGVSTFGLFIALARLPVGSVTRRMRERLPRRSLVGLLFFIAGVFTLLWLGAVVPALLSGAVPQAAVDAETPTSFIHVMDLAFVLPLSALAGVLILMGRPLGALLGGVVLVKGATISLAVLSMAAFMVADGQAVDAPVAAAMVVVLVAILLVGWRYFAAFGAAERATASRAFVGDGTR